MKRIGMGSVLVFLLAACGDDSAPGTAQNVNNTTNNATNGQNNTATNSSNNATNNGTNNSNNGTNNPTNNQTVCQPAEACAPDTCGMLDDGCGGVLDCGACPCVDGVPAEVVCGACELGTPVCGANETGFGSCELPIPGITDLTCDDIVFVRGGGVGDGSKGSPLNDILDAIALASTDNKNLVVVGGSATMSINGPLTLVQGIHVIGGFDDSFVPDPLARPVVLNTAVSSDQVFASQAVDVVETTHLKNVVLRTDDATTAGANTYGLWAHKAPGLVLTNVTLAPGKPGAGVAGEPGDMGIAGQNGFGGRNGNYRTGEGQPFPVRTDTVIGGLGCLGSARGGGAAGRGAGYSAPFNPTVLLGGTHGTLVAGGLGGLAGLNFTTTTSGTSGSPGQLGIFGSMAGTEGSAGAGLGAMDSMLFFVRAANGGSGGEGEHGWGGAGGGGAGAANSNTGGPSGGSGGGGGCGGLGGTGGTQGGSSFGLVLQASAGFLYIDLTSEPAEGAVGGAGGDAGPGGTGGIGGKGGDVLVSPSATKAATLLGGDGGSGGDGARGGHGGGGAGGHSIAVWCDGTYNIDEITGTPSAGGAGGASLGLVGEAGMSAVEYGCTL